jgi:hypothetical protein
MLPACPAASHCSNASAVSAGPVRVMPTRSKPSPSACALISDSIDARPSAITSGPARVAHDVRCRRHDARIAVCRQHSPSDVLAIGKGQKWKMSIPRTTPESPCDSDERRRCTGVPHSSERQGCRQANPRHMKDSPSKPDGTCRPSAARALGIRSVVRRAAAA